MGQRRRVFLVRNSKTNFHYLFVVLPSDYEQVRRGMLDIETINQLIQWKNVDELVAVIEKTGPIIASDIYKEANRLITIRDAVEIAEASVLSAANQGYGLNDEAFLRMQLYLDGCKGAYPSKASVARGVSNHGLLESGAAEDLRAWAADDPGAMVAIEPVADIVYARNLCSIALRLVANYQKPDVDDVLEASGFRHVELDRKPLVTSGYRDSYYVIPFHHNTMDDMTINFSWKWGRNVFAYMLIDPLAQIIYASKPKGVKHGFGSIESAATMSAPIITGNLRPIINWDFDYEKEDTRTYLAICDDVSQREAASRFVSGLETMISELKNKRAEPLGWDFSENHGLDVNGLPEPVFRTLFAAMVGTVAYRDGMVPIACKNCGNAFFIRPKGKRREYCSATCSSQYTAGNASRND